jgi:hypothetical protein
MLDDFERTKTRKKSEMNRNSFSSKFNIITDNKDSLSNSKLQSNKKLLSIFGQNLLKKNASNSNNNMPQISNIVESNIIIASSQSSKPNINSNTSININITENKTITNKPKENNSLKEKMSQKNKKQNNPFVPVEVSKWQQTNELITFMNGKEVKKTEEEIFLDQQYNTYDQYLKYFIKSKTLNQTHDNKDNVSSSNIGFSAAKSMSSKSDDKNMKMNLQNIMEYDRNDRKFKKMNYPCIILSDKINIENNENKLDLLMKTMEDYKDIIMEKAYCKNFQDRIILSIYISLSQISFKLYNCVENNKKLNHLRKYICGLTNNIKYNLFNNPNFTLSSINQKFIEIIDIKNQGNNNPINNSEDKSKSKSKSDTSDDAKSGTKKSEENTAEKNNDSSLNFSSKSNNNYSSTNTGENNNNNARENYKSFFDDEDEEIIFENFEDFKESEKDYLYPVNNILFDSDNNAKDNNNIHLNNNLENNNVNVRKRTSANATNEFGSKIPKNKLRRNAAHKIAFEKGNKNNNILNHNITNTNNVKRKEYDFQVIDVNGNEHINYSDDSIDSEEGCTEVHENHKYDMPKLLFYEDHVRDKDKRKINKINHVEIKPDPHFMKEKARIQELNEIGYKNIITIINKDPKFLPNYDDDLNPFRIAEYIQDKEKKALRQQNKFNLTSSKKLPNLKNAKKDEKKSKEIQDLNNSFLTHFYSKSNSFLQDNAEEDESDSDIEVDVNNILNFENDDD